MLHSFARMVINKKDADAKVSLLVFIKHEQACLGGGERNGISVDAKSDSFVVG